MVQGYVAKLETQAEEGCSNDTLPLTNPSFDFVWIEANHTAARKANWPGSSAPSHPTFDRSEADIQHFCERTAVH